MDAFFTGIFEEFGSEDRVLRFYRPPVLDNTIYVPLQRLHELLKTLENRLAADEDRLAADEDRLDAGSAAVRSLAFNDSLSSLLNQKLEGFVYWLEIARRKRYPRAALRGVPVNVSGLLKQELFEKFDRVILTSATLTTHRGFDFIRDRIGCESAEEMVLAAPFDYPAQALLYVPRDLPEPSEKLDVYIEGIARRCAQLIEASGGRTFILFTSYSVLNRVHEKLEFLGAKYRLLRQGDLPTAEMIRRFKEIPSVIFGTNSFWQGVDIPGDALHSVIIPKLPFDVPNEPLTEARIEDFKKNAIDPFTHYQIPRAIIQLKQGFGRLIRKQTDTGIVSILDTRIVNRSYGRHFLASLPGCRVVEDLDAVVQFFRERSAKE